MIEPKRPLDELVKEIEQQANAGDERLIAIAMLVREVKGRIEAGEAGPGVKWFEWANHNFRLPKTRLYELNHIANAKNPRIALESYRHKNRERQKAFQARAHERDPERIAVIKYIRTMHIEKVRRIHKFIAVLEGL
jgi:aminopeptidase N